MSDTKICIGCGAVMHRNGRSPSAWEPRKYCSRSCGGRHNHKTLGLSLAENFERYVIRTPEGCWGWKGSVDRDGYAKMTVNRRHKSAHRISLEIHGKEVPKGLFACHHCDNPICTNPEHLYAGTPRQNTQDAMNRGRIAKGSKQGMAKLTEQIVLEIRGSEAPNVVWAKHLGTSRHTVRLARLGKTWRHL